MSPDIIFFLKTDFLYILTGGLHRALQVSDIDAQVVRAFDWDQLACRVYDANYGDGIVKKVCGSLALQA